nr:hypothetical protein [Tanacetum cinerariifolium]
MHTVAGDGIVDIKRRRRNVSSNGVRNFATTSGRGRLKVDLESSTWRRRFRSCISRSRYQSVSKLATRCHKFDSIESCKSPTKRLFDVGSSRISIFIVKYHSDVWQDLKDNALDLCTLVLIIEGWSRLPPIQYQLTQSEKVNRYRVYLRDERDKFLLRETRMAGKGCALHHWVKEYQEKDKIGSNGAKTGSVKGKQEKDKTEQKREAGGKRPISCAVENQVKFTTCTMLDAALTWWNGHVRTLGHKDAYAMTWETFKKRLMDKYCPKEKVDKYISGLPDNIHRNVLSARPKNLDFAIELANDLMDQKLRTYAERQAGNKRIIDNNNQDQQQILKKQNMVQAYAVESGEKKLYGGSKPLCPKCNYPHNGECAPKCTNCKKVSHLTKDCWHPTNANNQRTITCYECGNQGHYRSDCLVLKNQGTEA